MKCSEPIDARRGRGGEHARCSRMCCAMHMPKERGAREQRGAKEAASKAKSSQSRVVDVWWKMLIVLGSLGVAVAFSSVATSPSVATPREDSCGPFYTCIYEQSWRAYGCAPLCMEYIAHLVLLGRHRELHWAHLPSRRTALDWPPLGDGCVPSRAAVAEASPNTTCGGHLCSPRRRSLRACLIPSSSRSVWQTSRASAFRRSYIVGRRDARRVC